MIIMVAQIKTGSHENMSRVFRFRMKFENISAGVNSYSIIKEIYFNSGRRTIFYFDNHIPAKETTTISDVDYKTAFNM